MHSIIRATWQTTLDLIFPPCCARCGRVDTPWCDPCTQDLTSVPLDVQPARLGKWANVASTGRHRGLLAEAVRALKYDGARHIAGPLGHRLTESLYTSLNWSFDTLVPVPLHPQRERQRGYNQAYLLAHAAAQASGYPVERDALIRVRATATQVGLDRQQRITNMREAFQATPHRVQGRSILLVDDVHTTGATLAACAQALRAAGAQHVFAITVTRAARRDGATAGY